MTLSHALFAAGLLASTAAVAGPAQEADAPLAVTTLAHPSALSTPTADQRELSQKFLASGLDLLKNGQPQKAVQAFNDSVRLAPGADNYKALGTAYYQSGNDLKAAWAWRESMALKPDPKVQALVDSLQGASAPASGGDARYRGLMDAAAGEARSGDVLAALRDYDGAYALKPGPESAGPGLVAAADAADAALKAGALSRAIEALVRAQPLAGAAGLDAAGQGAQERLRRDQAQAEKASGNSLAYHAKSMAMDHDAWARTVDQTPKEAR